MPEHTILVVDDTPANLELLATLLAKLGYEVRAALSGQMALMSIEVAQPDLVLLDINMPDMNGYEVCERLKENPVTADIPVIFVSALGETIDKVKAFKVGGVDYITKPFQIEEVVARIKAHITLYYQKREIEDLRQREREAFARISKLKDEFVRTVSHDLKNPIGVIAGYADLLEDDDDDTEMRRIFARKIKDSALRMNQLVVDLLDLARIEAGMELQLKPVLLSDFLTTAFENFELNALQKHQHLQLVIEADATLRIDPSRMGQVINNLLSNAIKYTPEGGQIELAGTVTEGQAIITLTDNGLGIPEDDIPHLFKKFFRVHTDEHMKAEGTGLGLSIVKAIVEQHGGDIGVESQLGQGTRFTIRLPLG